VTELRPLTSAIVPVHNARGTLVKVVETLLASDVVDEVVCIDDGSTDDSLAILRSFGRKIVLVEPRLPPHVGKGDALAEGIWKANGTIVIFVDAGLTTLTEDHLRALVEPLDSGPARAVLGSPSGGSVVSTFVSALTGARFTSERAYLRADLMRHLLPMARAEVSAERYLNGVFAKDTITVVPLAGLRRLGKQGRYARVETAREVVGEGVDLVAETLRRRLVSHVRVGARTRATPPRSAGHEWP
jgi:glycosyltransferase involved in cell wall biosynthesis